MRLLLSTKFPMDVRNVRIGGRRAPQRAGSGVVRGACGVGHRGRGGRASRKEEKSLEGGEKHMFFSFPGTGAAAAASTPAAQTAYSDKSLQSSSPAGGKTHLRRCDTGMGTRPSRTFARCEQACGV